MLMTASPLGAFTTKDCPYMAHYCILHTSRHPVKSPTTAASQYMRNPAHIEQGRQPPESGPSCEGRTSPAMSSPVPCQHIVRHGVQPRAKARKGVRDVPRCSAGSELTGPSRRPGSLKEEVDWAQCTCAQAHKRTRKRISCPVFMPSTVPFFNMQHE